MQREEWVKQLQEAQIALEGARSEAQRVLETALTSRDVAIRAAVADGMSMAEVGRITGVSRERIRQIVGED